MQLSSTTPHHLPNQPIMQLMTFNEAVEKGTLLLEAMKAPPDSSNTTQSTFDEINDLRTYGWKNHQEPDEQLVDPTEDLGLWKTYNAHEISTNPANNISIEWHHYNISQHPSGSPIYPATMALYDQVYNLSGHTIFTNIIRSPASDISANPRNLPPLQHWSDVTYLQWADLASSPEVRRGLRRVIQCRIENDDTRMILEDVLNRAGRSFEEWPGMAFTAESDLGAFKALLATPSVRGTAYMLAQRKGDDGLGWKIVERITIWKDWYLGKEKTVDNMRLYMMVEIGDVKETM